MSVSISPWCLGHCAHRGGGGREEIEGTAISLSTTAHPRLCTLSHPSFNLWGKVWRMQSGQVGGGTSGSVYKATRGRLTGSPSNPPLCAPTPLPPLLPLVPVSDAVVEISKVRWCFSLAAHTISLYPSPQWPPPRLNSQSGAAFDMLRQHFLCSQRLNS